MDRARSGEDSVRGGFPRLADEDHDRVTAALEEGSGAMEISRDGSDESEIGKPMEGSSGLGRRTLPFRDRLIEDETPNSGRGVSFGGKSR